MALEVMGPVTAETVLIVRTSVTREAELANCCERMDLAVAREILVRASSALRLRGSHAGFQ